ncbi:MAG: hypothetical protein ACI91B_004758 [Planctomycetota bacterium]
MRTRLAASRGKNLTADQFVGIAAKSSRTRDPYHMQHKDGTQVTAAKWFGEQLEEHRKKPVAAKGALPRP